MKKFIKNWVHKPGIHCGSIAIKDVASYYGLNLSEAMCFGLGGGLGFFYTKSEKMSPTRVIHLRGPGMEPNFFTLIDKSTEWKFEADGDKALELLKEHIDQDIPVLIQTDIYYLDYYNSNTHFPGHVVSVWGYDDEAETVFLSDTGFKGLQTVSYESLKEARSSKAEPYPLTNNWFEVNLGITFPPLSEIIPAAIRGNAKCMIKGIESSRGESSVRAIKIWADELKNWDEVQDWQWCSRFAYQVIERRGTGGGGFRFIYRDFLLEAQELVPVIKELNLAERMDIIGRKWSNVSMLLKRISEIERDTDLFKPVSREAKEIAELEESYFRQVIDLHI